MLKENLSKYLAYNNPFRSLNNANCHKLAAKLDNAEAAKADSDAIIKIFLRPYVSLRKPHKWDVKMMPAITRK